MPTIADMVAFLHELAPLNLAAEWDNVGLLLGDGGAPVQRIMTCLTITPETAAEAITGSVNLIVSHHPIFFRPVKSLTTDSRESRFLWNLARAGAAVYSPHTAFDNAPGGINDILARRLGLVDVVALRTGTAAECKIVVFVPESDLHGVSDAMFAAGAGHIGEYSQCSYRVTGTGTFFGSEQTNPTIGQKGQREEVTEWRLEVICPAEKVRPVIDAMRRAHSYEEPAFDIYPLQPKPTRHGQGRLGRLPAAVPLKILAQQTQSALSANLVQRVGDAETLVQSVALACGAAGEFLSDAIRARADVFLTGEMRFHDLLRAQTHGISLLLPGHYATERVGVEELANVLARRWPEVSVWASKSETDPVIVASG
jgi:dinuclear metal center YbgI/SA1388 family protein